ncbi:monofunctional biosynthetic peptidoglycan transglycosylase [Lysobacter sp. D1-1-M9]|uniref:monofunctional biosynthetic peptidoglycan transglycosylase n=1 Tax=Novilysobacter longmucuonensis TaxID=3098603 RepID=UPI002FCBFD83
MKKRSKAAKSGRRWWRRLLLLPVLLAALTVLQVLVLRFVDPPFTAFMAARQLQAWGAGDWGFQLAHDWRDVDRISANLPLAVIAAEDQNFARHHGFDLEAIRKARAHNARGRSIRGASTISQQTAKNLFLWSGGGWLRKGIEAWYTVLIEALWPKARIIEVYVNVAEFGDGVYGAQAAARTYFGQDASGLGAAQAARLAAVLPSPKRYSAAAPGPYVQRRTAAIQRQMRQIGGTGYLERID